MYHQDEVKNWNLLEDVNSRKFKCSGRLVADQQLNGVLQQQRPRNASKSPHTSPLLSEPLKRSQRLYSSSSFQLLSAGRWGSTGLAPQPSPDYRGPASFHLLHPRPQHTLCQFLSAFGPRRLPLEPGGWRGSVRFLWHIRSWRSVAELRYRWSGGGYLMKSLL